MVYLWNKPEHDSDWIMHERLTETLSLGDGVHLEKSTEVFDALGRVYYDVFNNGGCNLTDTVWLALCMNTLYEYAEEKSIQCPEFVRVDEYEDYDTVSTEDMDAFARQVIRHLYLDETAVFS